MANKFIEWINKEIDKSEKTDKVFYNMCLEFYYGPCKKPIDEEIEFIREYLGERYG